MSKNADMLMTFNRRIDARSMQTEDLTGQTGLTGCCGGAWLWLARLAGVVFKLLHSTDIQRHEFELRPAGEWGDYCTASRRLAIKTLLPRFEARAVSGVTSDYCSSSRPAHLPPAALFGMAGDLYLYYSQRSSRTASCGLPVSQCHSDVV